MQNYLLQEQCNFKQCNLTLSVSLQVNIIDNPLFFCSEIVYCRKYKFFSKLVCFQDCAKGMILIPSHLQYFKVPRNFYSFDLASRGKFDEDALTMETVFVDRKRYKHDTLTLMLHHIAENHIHQMLPNTTRIWTISLTTWLTSVMVEKLQSLLGAALEAWSSMSLALKLMYKCITLCYKRLLFQNHLTEYSIYSYIIGKTFSC